MPSSTLTDSADCSTPKCLSFQRFVHPKVPRHMPSEVNGCLVLFFSGKLYSLIWALLKLSFSSPLHCEGCKLGSSQSERQLEKLHSYSWEKLPVNTPGSEQGQFSEGAIELSTGSAARGQGVGQLARLFLTSGPSPCLGARGSWWSPLG